ncbi:MAG: 3-hydroxyacyl-CoA dehydrogenase NAD-binding domain-containing protein [Candidatus Omnitrophota bacterium]|nr:3-hydroxyacyl-CoA dehydrogenase NAD-binding domain-containing protein [Candidatus Omnitrophota bacterium]
MKLFNLKIEKAIAILEFDEQDSKVNVLNTAAMQELDELIKRLAAMPGSEVAALIITSKKDGIFIAGADIKEIEHITSSAEAKEKSEKGKEILDSLERLDIITVAAINGACLGGGLELALACKYRVASFSESVRLGLPEVNLGIIPGFGGTQRLPKLIGPIKALNMILSGQMVSSKDALKYFLVDRLFPETRLIDETIVFVQDLLQGKAKVKRGGKKKLLQKFLEGTSIGRSLVYSRARKDVLKKTKGFYPAPLAAIDVIEKSYGKDIKKGSRFESDAFAALAVTETSRNLIKVFYLNEEFKKYAWVDTKVKPDPVLKCGVVGAGVMGGGIAQLVSFYDIPTRIRDINYDALKKALKTAGKLYSYALKKRKLTAGQVEYKSGLISPTTSYKGFENTDIIIEAVVEDLVIKRNVFKELARITPPKTVLASNTSSLPITEIARDAASPERVVGLHFFNPVHRMPLVEVIRSAVSSDEAVATTIAFARRIGKVVIVVKDVPGFLINRILLSYMNEAGFLLEEGMKIEKVDSLARGFGMPMGPVELIDEVGVDVGYKVAGILEDAYGPRMRAASILEKVKDKGLLGKKTKKGFYLHDKNKKIPNKDIYKIIGSFARRQISDEAALKRLIYAMINEAARCLEEAVADRPQTVDIGMIMGTGFPPFRAGLLRYADSVGTDNIVKALRDLEKELNAVRFKPCGYLIGLAEKKRGFYGTI